MPPKINQHRSRSHHQRKSAYAKSAMPATKLTSVPQIISRPVTMVPAIKCPVKWNLKTRLNLVNGALGLLSY